MGPEITPQSLEDYMQRIPGHEKFCDHKAARRALQLQPGVVNRILYYPGSFNPPHIAHLALLQHIMKNSGSDMNFVATVVFPVDDTFIDNKLGPESEEFILTKDERVRLWRGYGRDDPFWVYGGSIAEWQVFKAKLVHELALDGLQLEVSVLGGPDRVVDVVKGPPGQWGYNEWLFSDFCRDIEDPTPGGLKQLETYEPWVPVEMNRKKSKEAAETVASYIIAGMYMTGPKNTANMLRKVPGLKEEMIEDVYTKSESSTSQAWLCRRKDSPDATMLFIPKPKDEVAPRISSSAIRKVIKESPPGKVESNLSGKVLHPDILSEILTERGIVLV